MYLIEFWCNFSSKLDFFFIVAIFFNVGFRYGILNNLWGTYIPYAWSTTHVYLEALRLVSVRFHILNCSVFHIVVSGLAVRITCEQKTSRNWTKFSRTMRKAYSTSMYFSSFRLLNSYLSVLVWVFLQHSFNTCIWKLRNTDILFLVINFLAGSKQSLLNMT